jgi:predicted SAM-dependent methyltransferase
MKECHRVLIPGGHLRFSCPDLQQYVEAYLNWNGDERPDKDKFSSGANFLNYAILGEGKRGIKYLSLVEKSEDHGHKYYYDENEMRKKLLAAGFSEVIRCSWKNSSVPEFQNIEWRGLMRDLFIEATN